MMRRHIQDYILGANKVFRYALPRIEPAPFSGTDFARISAGIVVYYLKKGIISVEGVESLRSSDYFRDKVREVLQEADRYYLEKAPSDGWEERVIPGARELLEWLRQRGVLCCIVSGNTRAVAEWKLKKAGLLDFFTVPNWKPPFGIHGDEGTKIDNLNLARSLFSDEIVYFGDCVGVDLCMKNLLGVPTVLVNRDHIPPSGGSITPYLSVPDLADPRIYPFLKQHLEI